MGIVLLTVLMVSGGYARPDALVSTEWLEQHLSDPSIRVVELRRDGPVGYSRGHIPGAVHLPNDAIRDPSNPPSFLPARETFERLMGELGISKSTRVIAVDDRGGLYAARLWWILHYFGHSNVALLDGHLIKWMHEKRPMTVTAPDVMPAQFKAEIRPHWLATADDILAGIRSPAVRIVDARTQAEIEGRDLRGIKRGGHIPSAIPVYWEDQLNPELKTLKPAEALRRLYDERGIQPTDEVIAYCQVGMRASHDLFVLYLLGFDRLRNYLGSWEEWGNRDDLPIVEKP